ncbi:MAG: hypothetical protein K2X27_06920 [Candidatus Obscuribacterales bacterium]|nr:hypothetical protein [Candidatus Obscuribacterales bacterium]
MEELLAKARQAVEKFQSKQNTDKLKGTKNLLSLIQDCKKYIEETEPDDSDKSPRLARELSEIFKELSFFRKIAGSQESLHKIQNKKLAGEHLDMIQAELEKEQKDLQDSKKKKIEDWVKSHPVFGKLKKSSSKKLPEGAYILLFRRTKSSNAKAKAEKMKAAKALAEARQNAANYESIPAGAIELVHTESELESTKEAETQLTTEPIKPHEPDSGMSAMESAIENESEPAKSESKAAEISTESTEKNARPQEAKKLVPNSELELISRPSSDGRIFTRFRPKEFSDDKRVFRLFRSAPPVVGACIIAGGKINASFGILPQAEGTKDQLRVLLSLSKEAVGKPGRQFIESHAVLNELFTLCKEKAVDKDSYILLFQLAEALNNGSGQNANPDSREQDAEAAGSQEQNEPAEAELQDLEIGEENIADDNTESESELELESDSSNPELKLKPEELQTETESFSADQSTSEENKTEESQNESSTQSAELEDEDGEDGELEESEDSAQYSDSDLLPASSFKLLSKTTEDGKVLTRYRSFHFTDSRSMFETFKDKDKVVGAAIIKDRQLLKVIGRVPSEPGKNQLDLLLNCSRQALEKPALDFVESNEVLKNLYAVSTGEFSKRDYTVVLFTEKDGRLSILALPDRRGKPLSRVLLSEFRSLKMLHDKFKHERVVGASIIAEQTTTAPSREPLTKATRERSAKPEREFKSKAITKSSAVVAAYGRTPLKQNVLLSADILKRLGVDLSILD